MKAIRSAQLTLLFSAIIEGLNLECFSCMSNANWSYYMERIPGLKALNASETLPVAPLACTFDPMRIYADRTAVACKGYCVKWASVKILDDGGLEVNFLRGCSGTMMRPGFEPPAARCYQTPSDFTHKPGVEYKTTCYCKAFMCNPSEISVPMVCVLTLSIITSLFV